MVVEQNNNGRDITARPTILRASELARSFGETRALQSASLVLERGQAHAIVGENGSGKSTLVKILSGILTEDAGTLEVEGELVTGRRSPRAARSLGIAPVFQEVLAIESRNVLDNIWLGLDGDFRGSVPEDERRERAADALGQLTDTPPPLDALIETLNLASRQICVIARALLQRPKILILDESTSALDVTVRDRLFETVRTLCAQGTGVLFTSHRMEEIAELGDSVTVLRSGVSVATLTRSEATTSELLSLMSGESRRDGWTRARRGRREAQPALVVEGLRLQPDSAPIDTVLHAGEIIGIAGLEGQGQDSFVRALAGVERPAAGTVICPCEDAPDRRVVDQAGAAAAGIAYVPRDRKTEGIFEPLSLIDNFSVATLGHDGKVLIGARRRRQRFTESVKQLQTRYGNGRDRITTLSGGNQQKIVLARWLATEPSVIVLNDPTRGVDHRTKVDIYKLLEELALRGATVVMLSTEVEEHLALMDRVLVFRGATMTAELDADQLTRTRLIGAYFGEHERAMAVA